LNLGKSPICIYCNECCYLQSYSHWYSLDIPILLSEQWSVKCKGWRRTNLLQALKKLHNRDNAGCQQVRRE
jgi:hypothetical protein